MDDQTVPFPRDLDAERAMAARGVNVVINELAAKRLGFQVAAGCARQDVQSELYTKGTGR